MILYVFESNARISLLGDTVFTSVSLIDIPLLLRDDVTKISGIHYVIIAENTFFNDAGNVVSINRVFKSDGVWIISLILVINKNWDKLLLLCYTLFIGEKIEIIE